LTKFLPLDKSGYPLDKTILYSIDSSYIPKRDLGVAEPIVQYNLDHPINSASDLLYPAYNNPYIYSVPSQEDIKIKKIKNYKAFYFIHPPADYLNYRQII
jgi:hypothetical protein